jgi:hypothetical protein
MPVENICRAFLECRANAVRHMQRWVLGCFFLANQTNNDEMSRQNHGGDGNGTVQQSAVAVTQAALEPGSTMRLLMPSSPSSNGISLYLIVDTLHLQDRVVLVT